MASDSLISVIGGLIRRENRMAREEKAKLKAAEAEEAEADEDEEEDEDEDPVGTPSPKAEQEPEDEEEPEPEADEPPPEAEPEDEEEPNPEGDTKPTGPDPTLVAQVAAIIKKELDDDKKQEKESEIKLSGKKEKINTKPKLEQEVRKGKMNFREAVRMSVTGTHLTEGYEDVVLGILEDEKIDGPLCYEPFFEKGKLYVEKGSEKKAAKALKQSREVNKVPKIVGEELSEEEYLQMEAVAVDGRLKGFREALRRLTYEKIKAMKKEGVEVPEGLSSEGAAEFMAAASAAKREGKKKFKFGGKEYPVTIKVDIPAKKEEAEINYEDMFLEEYDNLNEDGQLEVDVIFELFEDGELTEDEVIEGLADLLTKSGRTKRKIKKLEKEKEKDAEQAKDDETLAQLKKDKADRKAAKGPGAIKKGLKAIGKGLKKVFGKSDVSQSDAQKAVDAGKKAPPGWRTDENGKVVKSESVEEHKGTEPHKHPHEEDEIEESQELQAIMALDDAGIKADINRKGQVVIKKKDKKKAHQALEKSFKKGGWPPLKLEEVEDTVNEDLDWSTYLEMKMSAAAKKKRALWAKSAAGKKSLLKSKKRAKKVKSGAIKIDKAKGRAMAKARKKGGIRNEFEIDEASSKKARNKAADAIEAIADKGGAEAPTLFSLASKLRKGTHSTTGLKLSKQVTAILKVNGIKEEVQKTRTAYDIVSEARNRAIKNKPEWETEDSRLS